MNKKPVLFYKKTIYQVLVVIVVIASLALITINYYTIKTLSAVRAYINGESEFSKGQKDASLYLFVYIETRDSSYLPLFKKSLQIPIGDNMARKSLLNNNNDSTSGSYFLLGKNHPKDVPDMIWLFKAFKNSYMKIPIRIWTEAETLINQLEIMERDISDKIETGKLTENDKKNEVKNISDISAALYVKESNFSHVLGDVARQVNKELFYTNILCILIILGTISFYVVLTIRRLNSSHKKLEAINEEVTDANNELDTLIYSVSHDLRSPITSIQGLLYIASEENDVNTLKEYLNLIDATIKKQDVFIREIIDFFKNKRSSISFHQFSLKDLIEDVLANHKFIPMGRDIAIHNEIALDSVCSDELRVKMIINNLVSNAIKYSDERKEAKTIFIKTYKAQNDLVIEIADNGVGIDKKHLDKIYNMFFVTSHANKGIGLGLYILKQNVEKLNGQVIVKSEINAGTTFTIYLPLKQIKQQSKHSPA